MRLSAGRAALVGAVVIQGCGTLIPGARRQVDLQKYAFSYDGEKVFYQECRYKYSILSEKSRERMFVYIYETGKRKHRMIARSALMEVSPKGPYVYLGKDWGAKWSDDLILYDYRSRRATPIPVEGMKEGEPFIYISGIEWISEKDILADVALNPENPCEWRKGREKDNISVIRKGMIIQRGEAELIDEDLELPLVKKWSSASPDGRYILREERGDRYFEFHSTLYIEEIASGKRIYIIKDSRIRSFFEGVGYLFKYLSFGLLHIVGVK